MTAYGKDTEAGPWIYLCDARHYAPDEAHWTSRDPIGFDGGINVYSSTNRSGWTPSGNAR